MLTLLCQTYYMLKLCSEYAYITNEEYLSCLN